MDAIISGRAGTALLKDGHSLFSFDVDDVDTVVPRQQADLPFLFGDASDLQFLENVETDQVKRQLELAHNNACALDLTLILLDAELSDEVRAEAVIELEELFADAQIIERLEYILYARPLPDTADILGAIERSRQGQAATVIGVLQGLLDRQPFIRQAWEGWDAIPATAFGGEEQKAEFHHAAIHAGLFRTLFFACVGDSVENFLIEALMKPAIRLLRNYRAILQQWVSNIQRQTKALTKIEEATIVQYPASVSRATTAHQQFFWETYGDEAAVDLIAAIALKKADAERALDLLRYRHNSFVLKMASIILHGPFSKYLEDASQVVWLRVWDKVKVIEDISQFMRFLRTLSLQTALSFWKTESRYSELDASIGTKEWGLLPSGHPIFDPSVLSNSRQTIFDPLKAYGMRASPREILRSLRGIDRIIVILHVLGGITHNEFWLLLGTDTPVEVERLDAQALELLHGKKLTHKQIGKLIGMSEAAVRVRYSRARRQMSKYIAKHYENDVTDQDTESDSCSLPNQDRRSSR